LIDPAIKIEKESDDNFNISSLNIEIFEKLKIKQERRIATEKEEAKEIWRIAAKERNSREDVKERRRIAAKERNSREDVKERRRIEAKKRKEREDVKEKLRIIERKYRSREDVKKKKVNSSQGTKSKRRC
jgi:hypothetical protein